MDLVRLRVLRWVATAVAVAVLTGVAALIIFDDPPATTPVREPRKPHCYPHGAVPTFIRPGCD